MIRAFLRTRRKKRDDIVIGFKRGESPEQAFKRARREFLASSEWAKIMAQPLADLKTGDAGPVWFHYAGVLYINPDSRDLFIAEEVGANIPEVLIDASVHRLYFIRERLDAFNVYLEDSTIKFTIDFVNQTLASSDGHWVGDVMFHMGKVALIEDSIELWSAYFLPGSDAAKKLKLHLAKVEANSGRSMPFNMWPVDPEELETGDERVAGEPLRSASVH